MRWFRSGDGVRECGAPPTAEVAHTARRIKGPGTAVRPPPGTKYLIYGLVVASGDAPSARSFAPGKRVVCMSNPDLEEDTRHGVATAPVSSTTARVVVGDVDNVSEYDTVLNMILLLPLGASVEERATVRGCTWAGKVPSSVRPDVWRLLCSYMPSSSGSPSRQQTELRRRRGEYDDIVRRHEFLNNDFAQSNASGDAGVSSVDRRIKEEDKSVRNFLTSSASKRTSMSMVTLEERAILSQIALDLPRHSYALFHLPATVSALTRCLFLWSQRSPAVGYVQGIDDIMVVFFVVFLKDAFNQRNIRNRRKRQLDGADAVVMTEDACISASVVLSHDVNELGAAMEHLPEDLLRAAEADTYHCGGFFLSWLQDNFVHGQPGILRSMGLMERVMERVDPALLDVLASHQITLMDCCFQWVHCLLARELPLDLLVLLWEKYMAMGSGDTVLDFHVYVCVALLTQIRGHIFGKPMDVILQLLKDPLGARSSLHPTQQRRQESNGDSVFNHAWLEALVATASRMFHESLTSPLAS